MHQASLSKAYYGIENSSKRVPASNALLDEGSSQTPGSIDGGTVITTRQLHKILLDDTHPAVLNVTPPPHHEKIPYTAWWRFLAIKGSFSDDIQQRLKKGLYLTFLEDKSRPLVFYAQNKYNWAAYNAALRAIKLGYKDVRWYRGGIDAWKEAGLPLVTTRPPHTRWKKSLK